MKNKAIIVVALLIGVLLISGIYFYAKRESNADFPKIETNITFPAGEETLVTGKTYTLKWDNPESLGTTTSIFLVDSELLSQGASVSIADRIYGITDTGSYDYTIPTAVADSKYFFVIGTMMSNRFTITSSGN